MTYQVPQHDLLIPPKGRPLKSPKKKVTLEFGVRVKSDVTLAEPGTQTPGQKHRLCNTVQDKPFFEDSHTLSKPFNRKLWVILLIERNYAPVYNRYSFSLTLRIFFEIIPGCLSDFFLQRVIWRSYQRGTASKLAIDFIKKSLPTGVRKIGKTKIGNKTTYATKTM